MSEHYNGNGNHRPGMPAPYSAPAPLAFAPVHAEYEAVAEPERIQIGEYVGAIRRHLWLVAAMLAVGLGAAWGIVAFQQPEYRSTAMLEAKDGGGGGGAGRLGGLIGLTAALGGGGTCSPRSRS